MPNSCATMHLNCHGRGDFLGPSLHAPLPSASCPALVARGLWRAGRAGGPHAGPGEEVDAPGQRQEVEGRVPIWGSVRAREVCASRARQVSLRGQVLRFAESAVDTLRPPLRPSLHPSSGRRGRVQGCAGCPACTCVRARGAGGNRHALTAWRDVTVSSEALVSGLLPREAGGLTCGVSDTPPYPGLEETSP